MCYRTAYDARADSRSSEAGARVEAEYAIAVSLEIRELMSAPCHKKEGLPELDIEFMDSSEAPVGLGEPATTVVAPAIGNAIFAAVGVRLRHLPIRPNAVLKSLTQKS
jgi:hypothetical protein